MTTEKTEASMPSVDVLAGRFADWLQRLEDWILNDKRSLYGLAAARILGAAAVLGILFTNFRYRDITFGPGTNWIEPMQRGLSFPEPRIVESMGSTTFTIYYLAVMVVAVLFMLGWRSRITGWLTLIGWISIVESGSFLGDQGDNALRLGLIWLMFTSCADRWSLDERRRRQYEPVRMDWKSPQRWSTAWENLRTGHAVLPSWFTNVVHNLALASLAFQLVLIYISAGMFKTQGSLWQHGTALYYPLQLPQYEPFPFMTDLFTRFGVILGISTYIAVFTQLFFAPLLLRKVTRRIALTLVLLLHLAIAVLMALPWFSLAMIAFDAIFVSTTTYQWLERWLAVKLAPVKELWFDMTDPIANWWRS